MLAALLVEACAHHQHYGKSMIQSRSDPDTLLDFSLNKSQ